MDEYPKGTVVAFGRHGDSDWNKTRLKALRRHQLPPIRTTEKQDANLSAFGRFQMHLTGPFTGARYREVGGEWRCDAVIHSDFNRADQSANWAARAAGFAPHFTCVSPDLNEQSHAVALPPELAEFLFKLMSASDNDMQNGVSRDIVRQILDTLGQLPATPFPTPNYNSPVLGQGFQVGMFVSFMEALRHHMLSLNVAALKGEEHNRATRLATSRAMSSVLRRMDTRLLSVMADENTVSVLDRRKTPTGESYRDLLPRARRIARVIQTRANLYGDRYFMVMTHSKICIALRQIIEDLSDAEVERMLLAEGPPFPPNGSITMYKERDGGLVRVGEPWQLPPQLKANGREVELIDTSHPDVKRALYETGTALRRVRRTDYITGEKRMIWTVVDSLGPRLAVACSPYSLVGNRSSAPPASGNGAPPATT